MSLSYVLHSFVYMRANFYYMLTLIDPGYVTYSRNLPKTWKISAKFVIVRKRLAVICFDERRNNCAFNIYPPYPSYSTSLLLKSNHNFSIRCTNKFLPLELIACSQVVAQHISKFKEMGIIYGNAFFCVSLRF